MIRRLKPGLVKLKHVTEAIRKCTECAERKDNRYRKEKIEESLKERDMAGVDIVVINPPSHGQVAVILSRHRLSGLFAGRCLQSHREEDIAQAMREMFHKDIPIPTVVRVDGERGFTVRVREEMNGAGITDMQTAPPYRHTAQGYIENGIKRFTEMLRVTMAEKNAGLEDWAKFVPLTIARLNRWPNKDGISSASRAYGGDGATWYVNRLSRAVSGQSIPFKVGERVLYAEPNRKERPGFNKLNGVFEEAVVIQFIDRLIRRVKKKDGSTTLAHINNLRKWVGSEEAYEETDMNGESDHQQAKGCLEPEAVTQQPQTNVDAGTSPKPQEIEPGQLVVFESKGKQWAGAVVSAGRHTYEVHIWARLTPKGRDTRTWAPVWMQKDKVRNTLGCAVRKSKPQDDHACTWSPLTVTVGRNEGSIRTTEDLNNHEAEDGRDYMFNMAKMVAFMAKTGTADTTHQKVRYSKLEGVDKKRADQAFWKEIKKFEEWKVYEEVQKDKVPQGALVVRPVVVFTEKRDPITGARTMKCRITADGSAVRMPDTATDNAPVEH